MKKFLTILFSLILLSGLLVPVSANDYRVIDEADVLSESEETELCSLIDDFIAKTGYDIVVYFAYQNDYFDKYEDAITALADDTYDYGGYGLGDDNSGLIMCVDVYYRDYTITVCGNACIDSFTDLALEDMYSQITPYLSSDDWAGAAKTFVQTAGEVYDNYSYYHQVAQTDSLVTTLIPALVHAFIPAIIITLVVFLILRGQLKHTGVKHTATEYMNSSNINISRSGDIFLYKDVRTCKIEKPKPTVSTSSGSTVHVSSSGRTHGGGGSHRF